MLKREIIFLAFAIAQIAALGVIFAISLDLHDHAFAVQLNAVASAQRFFYPLFAVAIIASVQLVGIYRVFSSLIIPALAMRQVKKHFEAKGYALGAVAYGLGVIASQMYDLPTGPVIVWMLTITVVITVLFYAHDRFAAILGVCITAQLAEICASPALESIKSSRYLATMFSLELRGLGRPLFAIYIE